MIVFGHRGAPGYPRHGENTIASFKKALAEGAAGLEFDVRRCGDRRIVVIHDDTIDRTTTGRGAVAALSYDQIRKFDAGWGEPVPLLSDVLDQFGGRCLLNVELKDSGIADDVKRLVLERRLESQVIVSAFDWDELAALTPAVPIGLLASKPQELVAAARRMGAAAIHPRRDIVSPALVAVALEAGLRIHVFTVNDPAEAFRLGALGIDGIFTDCPERMVGLNARART